MITVLGITLIVILVAVEIGCFILLRKILHQRSDERTDARRAAYRDKAYNDIAEIRRLKNNRQELWQSLQK
jgi:hypothetical protein